MVFIGQGCSGPAHPHPLETNMNENRLKFYLERRKQTDDWCLRVVFDDEWHESMSVKEWSKKPDEKTVENTVQLVNRSFEVLSRYLGKAVVREMDTIRQGILQDKIIGGK